MLKNSNAEKLKGGIRTTDSLEKVAGKSGKSR
jgi:hypothetical protein